MSKVKKTTHSVFELNFGPVGTADKPILKALMDMTGIYRDVFHTFPQEVDGREVRSTGSAVTEMVYRIELDCDATDEQVELLFSNAKAQLKRLTDLRDDLHVLNMAS